MTSTCMVKLSGIHLVLLFCDHTGSIPLSEVVHDAFKTAVMAHPDLHHCCTALLQPILPVLINLYNDFSLLSLQEKTIESMEAMLKMLTHTLCHPRLPLSYPLTTPMQTGMNTISRRS